MGYARARMDVSAWRRWQVLAVVIFATALTFAVAVTFPFVGWDDPRYVSANPLVAHPLSLGLKTLLTTPALGYPQSVTVLSYSVNRAIFGAAPWSFHLVNLGLHLLNVALVARIAAAVGLAERDASLSAMLFALHPIVAEPVCWVTGRKDLLATSLVLGAAALLLRGGRGAPFPGVARWAGATALCTVGMGAKPSASVAAFVLVAVLAAARPAWPLRRLAAALTPLAIVGAAVVALAGRAQAEAHDTHGRSLTEATLDVLGAFTLQMEHLAWPVGLVTHYERDPGDPSAPAMVLGALVLGTLLVALVRLDRRGPVFAGLWVSLVAFAPMSNLLAVNRWTADSYMYLPLAGVAIAAVGSARALLGSRLARVERIAWPALAAALALDALGQASNWRTPESVWMAVVDRYPKSPVGYTEVAKTLAWEGRSDQATAAYVDLDARFPDFESALDDRAAARLSTGAPARALDLLSRGVTTGSGEERACARRLWLGIVERQLDARRATREVLERSFDLVLPELRAQVGDPRVWALISATLRGAGSDARAEQAAQTAAQGR